MSTNNPIILVCEPLAQAPMAWLKGVARVIEGGCACEAFAANAQDATGLVVRTYTNVDRALLDRLPNLKVVGRAGVGVDNIDLDACAARGVTVVHTPDANTQAVVEYVVCLLGDALRPRVFLDHALPLDQWEHARSEIVASRQMSELTLGILGCGRVGSRLAEVAQAIGFRVLFNDLLNVKPAHASSAMRVDAETLFRESDILSIHIDGRPSNRDFVGAPIIGLMRSDVVVINTSRGMVLQTEALALFLQANPKARAILDVHDPEPFTADNPLVKLPNAFLAPHLASRTETAMTNMSWVVRDVIEVAMGRTPKFQVGFKA